MLQIRRDRSIEFRTNLRTPVFNKRPGKPADIKRKFQATNLCNFANEQFYMLTI